MPYLGRWGWVRPAMGIRGPRSKVPLDGGGNDGRAVVGGPNAAGRYGRRGRPIAIRSHRGKGLPIYPGRSYMCRHGAETGSATAARASRSATHAIARRVGRGLSVSPELPGLGLLARRAKDDVPAAAGRGIQSGAPDVLSYGEMLNP